MPLKTLFAVRRLIYRHRRRRRFLPPCAPSDSVLAVSRRRAVHLAPLLRLAAPLRLSPRPFARCVRARVAPLRRLAARDALILDDSRAVGTFIDFDHKTRICPLCRRLVTCCVSSVRAIHSAAFLYVMPGAFGGGSAPRSLSLRHGGGNARPLRAFGDGERTAPRLRVALFIARGMGACPLSAFARVFSGQYLVP